MTTISDDELSQTPLHALGRRLGAQFMSVAGYANNAPSARVSSPSSIDGVLAKFVDWLNCKDACEAASAVPRTGQESLLGYERELPGHGGEPNSYVLRRRGRILLIPMTEAWLYRQLGPVLAAGNDAVIYSPSKLESCLNGLPLAVANRVSWTRDLAAAGAFAGTVKEGHRDHIPIASQVIAASPSLLVSVEEAQTAQIECDAEAHRNNWQLEYGLTPLDVTASGGNASLMILELSS